MKKLLVLFGASIFTLFFACDKADVTDIHFIEYNLKNETDYYVRVNTYFLTSLGTFDPSYFGYNGLDVNYYKSSQSVLIGDSLFIFDENKQAVKIPQPYEYDTYTQKIDTIYPKQTIKIKIPVWDNHYRELPPYDSVENVFVINPDTLPYDLFKANPYESIVALKNIKNSNKSRYERIVRYEGIGYYCESVDAERISSNINIIFLGTFCNGEYVDSKLILHQTELPNFEKTIQERVDENSSKDIIIK